MKNTKNSDGLTSKERKQLAEKAFNRAPSPEALEKYEQNRNQKKNQSN